MINKILNHIDETINHKQHVLESAKILSEYLVLNDKLDDAITLIIRCSVHDNSKFTKEERNSLLNIENKDSLKDPRIKMDDKLKETLKIHWKNNSHHPEHYDDYSKMTEMDITEMACDWNARSMEYNTNLLKFVETRQNERFYFDEVLYLKLYKYCQMLISNNKNKVYIK